MDQRRITMNSEEECKSINDWIEDLAVIAQQDFGMLNWTKKALIANFAARHAEGKTPYQAMKLEGYQLLEERKSSN